jgi:hypothetical protein
MIQAGTPCPIDGKIGKEALALWKLYEFERPDYKAYVKRMKKREKVKPVVVEPVIITDPKPMVDKVKVEWQNPK